MVWVVFKFCICLTHHNAAVRGIDSILSSGLSGLNESYGTELLFEMAKDNISSQNNNDKG